MQWTRFKELAEKVNKRRQRPKKLRDQNKPTVRLKRLVSKVKKLISSPNPPSQRKISRSLGISVRTMNRVTHDDFHTGTRKKMRTHALSHVQVAKRKEIVPRLLKHLSQKKLDYIISLDEAWLSVNNTAGQRDIF